ncbi:MAG: MBL fold metallo-hydrolase [Lachnospiraceae bacterium]|jgi:metallo-beta-lactamase family protein|nr:MBL fold metallo-hydrolase [Lachnospiraceae bacterium]
MKLEFIGADQEVTGSCHYLKVGVLNILVDCGMEQGRNIFVNAALPVAPSAINYVFLTHAHIDHTGMLPKLYKDGFCGQVITTEATMKLSDIMLRDSAHIQSSEAEWKNKRARREGTGEKAEPLYTVEDVIGLMRLFRPFRYGKRYKLCNGVEFRFTDVGHLLGSASIELWLSEGDTEKKIVFSGDIGNKNQPLLKDPELTAEADYVLVESTYGSRLHDVHTGDYEQELADIIRTTLLRGGNVVIPSFAVGRTQEMLYFIRKIKQKNLFPEKPDFPVYVDSPLAVDATGVFSETGQECYDEEAMDYVRRGINPLSFPNLNLTVSVDESKAINEDPEPKVIIAASGMCDAGRIRHHLKYNLWRPECTILFVGYQAEGTPGRNIADGATEVKLFGEVITVRAEIKMFDGLSGHADRQGLLDWMKGFTKKPAQVFVVHGDEENAASFVKLLNEEAGLNAMAPFSGTEYDLAADCFIKLTEGVRIGRPETAPEKGNGQGAESTGKARLPHTVSDSYTNLKMTGRRLTDVIEGCSGMANKDLDAFSKELQALAEKYRIDEH